MRVTLRQIETVKMLAHRHFGDDAEVWLFGSRKDVKLRAGNPPDPNTCASSKLPSMALDSGIHAGMTMFSRSVGLVYNDEGTPWARRWARTIIAGVPSCE